MKLIVPMAGRGTRLRPHTHVTPKPLLPVVGIPMVERIVNTFADVLPRPLTEGVFILGDFPHEVNEQLQAICERHGMIATFVYQDKALGTGHAVYCAKESLEGEVIVVFADTLFSMSEKPDLDSSDVVAWVKHVDDPRRFGVVVKDGDRITDFVEKPSEIISNEALIGIYFVHDGQRLRDALTHIMEHDVTGHGGEYQLTDAFDYLLKQGLDFGTASVDEWLDCGTIEAFMETSFHLLDGADDSGFGNDQNATIISPVYIGDDVTILNSVIGPNVVLESGTVVKNSVVESSILFPGASVKSTVLKDALIGRDARVQGQPLTINIGDHASHG